MPDPTMMPGMNTGGVCGTFTCGPTHTMKCPPCPGTQSSGGVCGTFTCGPTHTSPCSPCTGTYLFKKNGGGKKNGGKGPEVGNDKGGQGVSRNLCLKGAQSCGKSQGDV